MAETPLMLLMWVILSTSCCFLPSRYWRGCFRRASPSKRPVAVGLIHPSSVSTCCVVTSGGASPSPAPPSGSNRNLWTNSHQHKVNRWALCARSHLLQICNYQLHCSCQDPSDVSSHDSCSDSSAEPTNKTWGLERGTEREDEPFETPATSAGII